MPYVVTEQDMAQLDRDVQQRFGQDAPLHPLFVMFRNAFHTYIIYSPTTSTQDLVNTAVRALAGLRVSPDSKVSYRGVPVAMLVPFIFTDINTGADNNAVAVSNVFPRAFGADLSFEYMDGQTAVRQAMQGLRSTLFGTAEAGIEWGPDGNTNIGMSISDSIGRSIVTAGVDPLRNYSI